MLHLLRGSPNEKRLVLTVIDQYKHYHLKPNTDIRTITDPGTPLDVKMVESYTNFISKWIKSRAVPKVKTKYQWHNPGSKSGPNGHALLTSHYDMISIIKKEGMIDNLVTLAGLSNQVGRVAIFNNFPHDQWEDDRECYTSRLAQLCEPGGKTRTIGIGDYFSQLVLRPLHDVLMEFLKDLRTDGT